MSDAWPDGVDVDCPYCASPFWLAVDAGGAATQRFTSDCEVCCRPIVFRTRHNEDRTIDVDTATEDESP